jgi:hypothetical protein
MSGKSFDKYDFKIKLSKHELILERYKTILNTSVNKTENIIYKDAEPSVNYECRSTSEELLKDILFNKESVKTMLNPNDFINKEIVNDNFCDKDNLDLIRNKYIKNVNNSYKLSNTNLIKNNTSKINNLIDQANTDLEVEKIKLKYINNFNKHEITTNKVLEDKLSKYRKEYLDSEKDSNKFIVCEKEIKLTNNTNEKFEEKISNELLDRLSSIENKLNQLNLLSFTKPSEINDKIEIPKVKSLKEEEVINNPIKEKICKSKEISTTVKEKISSLKNEKILIKENLKIKSSICTKDILNKIIEDVTAKLFHDNLEKDDNNSEKCEIKDNLLINKDFEKISKFSKSRTNIPSKIKIPSFEEFLQNESN